MKTSPHALNFLSGLPILPCVFVYVALLAAGPAEGGNIDLQRPDVLGYLDITSPPYSADPTGQRDSTQAIQQAVDHARWHCLAVFFPPGTYLVSDMVRCQQGVLKNRHKERTKDPVARAMGLGGGVRALPCALFGSRRGERRPVVKLAPNSPGFGDPEKPKPVIRFRRGAVGNPEREQPNASFEQMFVNINIEIGPGNPGAIGIQHRAAQGSGVQDCTITATGAFAGLSGGAGSGGGHANVTVIGGKYGAYLRGAQPAPTITAFTLLNQEVAGILYGGYQALTAVGVRIQSNRAATLVSTSCWPGSKDTYGQFSLVDSILVSGRGQSDTTTGVSAGANVYLHNVYTKGLTTLVTTEQDEPAPQPAQEDGTGWRRIRTYAHGIDPTQVNLPFKTITSPVYTDGTRNARQVLLESEATVAPEGPPADLQSRHLWPDPFPSWESPGAVSVKAPPYSASGDGKTDDAAAIQRAINEHEIVFVPRGVFRVSRTIDLKPNTKLIGLHQSFSRLAPLVDAEGGHFNDRGNPQPVLRTADSKDGDAIVAFLGISAGHAATYCLHWRTGRHSILRSMTFNPPSERSSKSYPDTHVSSSHASIYASGNGGGKWYNVHEDAGGSRHPDYRHFLIEGTSEPLGLYQCNPEHSASGCNLEARNARYVSIYGLKGESPIPIGRFLSCDHIRIFGYGGLAASKTPGDAVLHFRSTPNFLAANLMDRFMRRERNADKWHILIDEQTGKDAVNVPPLERPVLYRRGTPLAEGRAK